MSSSSFRQTIRIMGFVAAMLASAAIAADNNDAKPDPKAECLNKAILQYTLDDAFCFNYPPESVMRGQCRTEATIKYGRATADCVAAREGGKVPRRPFAVAPRNMAVGTIG